MTGPFPYSSKASIRQPKIKDGGYRNIKNKEMSRTASLKRLSLTVIGQFGSIMRRNMLLARTFSKHKGGTLVVCSGFTIGFCSAQVSHVWKVTISAVLTQA